MGGNVLKNIDKLLRSMQKEHLFFDGGFGSYVIEKFGNISSINSNFMVLLNFSREDIVVGIHKEYIKAGVNFITANTFSANRYKLKDTQYSVEEVVSKGIELSKLAIKESGKEVSIAQSISPIGKLLMPNGDLSFDCAYDIFKEQVMAGEEAGCDLYLLETFSDIGELRSAVLACKENSHKPIFATMTFDESGKTLMGTDPKTFVNIIQNLGVDVIGINCSLGPKSLKNILEEMVEYSNIPVLVQPNRGLPKQINENLYSSTKEEFLENMVELCNVGVQIIGGCCGTTPEFIKILVDNKDKFNFKKSYNKNLSLVSSATKTIDLRDNIHIVGERINPTGKLILQEELKQGKFDYVISEAIKQVECGADILDINAVVSGVNEVESLYNMMNAITEIIDVPLQFDSMNAKAIEKVLRYYNGRGIVNSINAKKRVLDEYLPIIKKYGAMVVALTIDEKGIPKNKEEKIIVAEEILEKCLNFGLNKNDIIFDTLTLTVSAQQKDVFPAILCLRELKEKHKVLTLLGISNVSFGMPNRSLLNRTFLSFGIANGMDLAIIDPLDKSMINTIEASRVLLDIDRDCENYTDMFKEGSNFVNIVEKNQKNSSDYTLTEIILKGLRTLAKEKTENIIKENISIDDIINNELIATLDLVGEKFSKNELFLPDLIKSAEAVKISFDVIKQHIVRNGDKRNSKGKIILATVKGDVHDIGKNIVKTILESNGYDIIDLGKNVESGEIIRAIKENDVKLIGLSALMTKTVESMREIIKAIKEESLDCGIMVGGAVLTEEFAKEIGADFYGDNANDSVKIANNFFIRRDCN